MLTVRSKASADWLLIFSACMPLVAGLCCLFISLVVMLIIKTRSWRVSWWLSSLQIFILFTHLAMFCCHYIMVTWQMLRHVTASRDLPHVVIASRTAWRGVITSLCDSERAGIMRAPASCDSVTWHCHVTSPPSLLASHSPLHSRSVFVWNKEIIIVTLDGW